MKDIMKFFIVTMLTAVAADSVMSCASASLRDCVTSMQRELESTLDDAIEFCRIKDQAFNKTLMCVKQKLQGCQTGSEAANTKSVTQKMASYNKRHNCSRINPIDAAVRSGSLAICDPASDYKTCMISLRQKMGELTDSDMKKEFCRVKDGLFNETLSCVKRKLATCHPDVAKAYRSNAEREIRAYENLHSCSCGNITSIHEICTEELPDHANKEEHCMALQEEIECAREEAGLCDMEEQLQAFYVPRVVRHSIRHSCCISASAEEIAEESTHDFHSCVPYGGVSETEARLIFRVLESSAPIRGICGILAKIDRPTEVFRCWLKAAKTCTQQLGDYVENKIKRISQTCGILTTTPQLTTTSSTGNDVTADVDQVTSQKSASISSTEYDVTSPVVSRSTQIVDVDSAVVSRSTQIVDVTSALVSSSTQNDDVTSPVVSSSTQIDEVTSPVVSSSTQIDDVTSPAVASSTQIDDVTSPVVSSSTQIDDVTSPDVASSTLIDDVTSPMVASSTQIDDVTSAVELETENPVTGTSPTHFNPATKPTADGFRDTTPPADNSGSLHKAFMFASLTGVFTSALLGFVRH